MTNDLWGILQNNPDLKEGLDEDTLAVATSGGNSTKRMSIRGGNFHKVINGREVSTIEDNHVEVVIVKMAHNASRTFYEGEYEEGILNYLMKKYQHLKLKTVMFVDLV